VELTKDIFIYPWTNIAINNCNSYLIGRENSILIDPGLDFCLKGVLDAIKQDGIDPEQIAFIINTHCHPDHFEGIKNFLQKDTKIALHREEDRFMQETGKGFYNMFGLAFPEYRVDIFLEEGKLNLNNTPLEIYHTPGHSPGSVSILLPEKKTLIVGDVIFQAGVGRTDFPGGDGSLLKKSIDKLSHMDVEFLLPGHGDIIQGKDRVKRNFDHVADVYYNII
jgi:glyoxylase-like metal-dependent hydrolase (beta-lactamase superfamily II)